MKVDQFGLRREQKCVYCKKCGFRVTNKKRVFVCDEQKNVGVSKGRRVSQKNALSCTWSPVLLIDYVSEQFAAISYFLK